MATSLLDSAPQVAPGWVDESEYPFVHHWLALPAEAHAPRMHYVDEGHGEPLLFVHGTPSWSFEWRHLVRGLSRSFRCVAPDLLGFGLSDRPRDYAYTPEAHARSLAAFVDALGLEDFTLVVHDYGGPIGLPLALATPRRVRRIVLLNTWMWSFAGDAGMERKAKIAGSALGRLLYRRLNFSLRVLMPHAYGDKRKLTPSVHAQYRAPFPDAWSRGAVLWPLARAILGSGAYYDSLWQQRDQLREVPALIVWGMQDAAFPPHYLARWTSVLPAARVVELPAGHWPHEELPKEVLRAVSGFLTA